MAEAVEHILEHALVEWKRTVPPAVLADGQDFRDELAVAEHEARAGFGLFAGLEDDLPIRQVQPTQEQELNRAAGACPSRPYQARGDGAGLVDNQHVAGVQVVDHIAEDFILDARRCRGGMTSRRLAVARLDGRLRDQLLRKIIVKITCLPC